MNYEDKLNAIEEDKWGSGNKEKRRLGMTPQLGEHTKDELRYQKYAGIEPGQKIIKPHKINPESYKEMPNEARELFGLPTRKPVGEEEFGKEMQRLEQKMSELKRDAYYSQDATEELEKIRKEYNDMMQEYVSRFGKKGYKI